MLKEFLHDLKKVYAELLLGVDNIDEFLTKWNIDKSIGEVYQSLINKEERKKSGSVYTPKEVVSYIVNNLISYEDYKNNPYIKILDPSCGGGYFLVEIYEKLVHFAESMNIKNPKKHVLNYNIYGVDTDEYAVIITSLELYRKSNLLTKNILLKDFLFDYDGKFDVIVGNPPYLGHKQIDDEYRKKLMGNFNDVFYDKGDLAYCFIKRAIDLLNNDGRLVFFTSRYLLEAQNAKGIRSYIVNNGVLDKIIDFYGIRVFKGTGIDNVILFFTKNVQNDRLDYYRLTSRCKYNINSLFSDIENNKLCVKHIQILKNELNDEGWQFLNGLEKSILKKIEGIEIGDICETYQGIITGCDSAFVVTREEAEINNIEKDLLKPWIKSSNINKFTVEKTDKFIIYSNLIDDEEKYKYAIKYIEKYKERLIKRRECQKGTRKWYQLQWGRDLSIFKETKIIFPYKSSTNKFAIDKEHFFSADVYALKLKDLFKNLYTYEFLVGVLNSTIYEFYIKTYLKKLGNNLYEYYPYNILKIKIPDYIKDVENEVLTQGHPNIKNIDEVLIEKFKITKEEFDEIKFWIII